MSRQPCWPTDYPREKGSIHIFIFINIDIVYFFYRPIIAFSSPEGHNFKKIYINAILRNKTKKSY